MLLRATGLATFAEVEPTSWATLGANMRAAIVYDGINEEERSGDDWSK